IAAVRSPSLGPINKKAPAQTGTGAQALAVPPSFPTQTGRALCGHLYGPVRLTGTNPAQLTGAARVRPAAQEGFSARLPRPASTNSGLADRPGRAYSFPSSPLCRE